MRAVNFTGPKVSVVNEADLGPGDIKHPLVTTEEQARIKAMQDEKYEKSRKFLDDLYHSNRVQEEIKNSLYYDMKDKGDNRLNPKAPDKSVSDADVINTMPSSYRYDDERVRDQARMYRAFAYNRPFVKNEGDTGFKVEPDMLPEVVRKNPEAVNTLMMAYPERFESGEFFTPEGISMGIADLMSDPQNTHNRFYDSGSKKENAHGYVERDNLSTRTDYEMEEMNEYYRQNPDEYRERLITTRNNAGQSSQYEDKYAGRRTRYGSSKGRPFIMGLGGQMQRQNFGIQVGADKPMSVYVHESSHAGDLGGRSTPFNSALTENYKVLPQDADPSVGNEYIMTPKQFIDYVGSDTETLARLNDIRYVANERFGDRSFDLDYNSPEAREFLKEVGTYDLDQHDFINDQLPNGFQGLSDLQQIYSDEEIIDMLNRFY